MAAWQGAVPIGQLEPPNRRRNTARGHAAELQGVGTAHPECGVALLDRRVTAALRSAPGLV